MSKISPKIPALFILSSTLALSCKAPGKPDRAPAALPVATEAVPQNSPDDSVVLLPGGPSPLPESVAPPCGLDPEDRDSACLALKVVSYEAASVGGTALSREQAQDDITAVNRIWDSCKIRFLLEIYQSAAPEPLGLTENPSNTGELPIIRRTLEDSERFLLVVTGAWNRAGSLGNTGANAWAAMPGNLPYGIIMEEAVATFGNIVAHELGHYLGLDHSSDSRNLMSPLIYDNSTELRAADCALAHSTLQTHWSAMLRRP